MHPVIIGSEPPKEGTELGTPGELPATGSISTVCRDIDRRRMVRVCCPHAGCGQHYRVVDTLLGQTTVCKRCGREFSLSASLAACAADEAAGPPELVEDPDSGDLLPQRIGRFVVHSRLGAGGFGTVYRARDRCSTARWR